MKFKYDINPRDFENMTGPTLLLLGKVYAYCFLNGIECRLTSLMDNVPGRESITHKTGRAFDISVRPFKSEEQIEQMAEYFNIKYADIGAISISDLRPRVCVYHNGTAMHLHFQTRPVNHIKRQTLEDLFI